MTFTATEALSDTLTEVEESTRKNPNGFQSNQSIISQILIIH